MIATVRKWGNSLSVRLPQAIAGHFAMGPGSEVDIAIIEGRIVIEPLDFPKFDVERLIGAITPDCRRPEADWGPFAPWMIH